MTSRRGFFVEHVSVIGTALPVAEIDLIDGLNVIEGASDTGKSYLCSLIDFAFGAKDPPRAIDAAKGYEAVRVRIRARADEKLYELERSLTGGHLRLREIDPKTGAGTNERVVGWKHVAGDDTTLSAFLLALSGFTPTKIRKNANGDTRSLSFRDVVFLSIIDETRIISENPPHLSDPGPLRTSEGEVLRLMVTGLASAPPIVLPKTTAGNAKAQLSLVEQMIAQSEGTLATLNVGPLTIAEELAALDKAREVVLAGYEETRLEVTKAEEARAVTARQLRAIESRLLTLETLLRRFELLDRHYASDLDRLTATKEAGSLLQSLPQESCPVCGAAPEAHRPEEAASHFSLEEVQLGAQAELEKVAALRADLSSVISEMRSEAAQLTEQRTALREEARATERTIESDLRPRLRASAQQLDTEQAHRDRLLRAQAILEQLASLRATEAPLRLRANIGKGTKAAATRPTSAEMDELARAIQKILNAWKFPDLGRVVFSDDKQDLVINNQDRASHGKGVRALTCAAFIAGVLRHCSEKRLAHPGFIAFDSPLVAYKDPDQAGTDSAKLRQAGVKDAFYRDLATWATIGQVIVFENEVPPPDVAANFRHHHFTKTTVGRYGFFPPRG